MRIHAIRGSGAAKKKMTEEFGDVIGSIRAVRSEQGKLTKGLEELRSQLESEVHQVDQLLDDKTKGLKEAVLCCPPIFVTISTPKDSNLQLNLNRDSERPWISSRFYTHPGGYKLCLALKSTDINSEPWIENKLADPRLYMLYGKATRKPKLFISIVAISQENDDHRMWPCEGEATLRLLGQGQRKGGLFTMKFFIEKSISIQPDRDHDAKLAMSEIKDWVALSETSIPFDQTYYPGSGNPCLSYHQYDFDDDNIPCYPSGVCVPHQTTSIPSNKMDIRIETIVLSEKCKVWNNS